MPYAQACSNELPDRVPLGSHFFPHLCPKLSNSGPYWTPGQGRLLQYQMQQLSETGGMNLALSLTMLHVDNSTSLGPMADRPTGQAVILQCLLLSLGLESMMSSQSLLPPPRLSDKLLLYHALKRACPEGGAGNPIAVEAYRIMQRPFSDQGQIC